MPASEVLTGKAALVTGGGRGIGEAIALELAAQGMAVAIASRSEQELQAVVARIAKAGGQAIAIPADISQFEDVERMFAETEKRLGPVDLLVNNAGIYGVFGPLWEADVERWWRTLEINLRGTFLCAREALRGMVARKQGRIVNISSGLGSFPTPYGSAYGCSKAAVFHLTNSMALEGKEHGISVFAISPGMVHTRMAVEIEEDENRQRWLPRGGESPTWLEPERAAQIVAFLASGQADRLSGRYIHASYQLDDLLEQIDEIEREDLYTLRMRT